MKKEDAADQINGKDNDLLNASVQRFTLKEVADATDNFNPASYLGEGGFGKVYKGYLARADQVCFIYIWL